MTTQAIEELNVVGVYDPGIPNLERIVLFVNEQIDMGSYGLMLGVRGSGGVALPIRDNLLWLGNGWVSKGDWIFIYTAPGDSKTTPLPNNDEKLYSVHWGKKQTVFQNRDIVPILFRMDAVQIPTSMPALASDQEAGA